MRKKAEIMDRDGVTRALTRISHEITEKNSGAEDLVIVGIKRRGVSLAKMIHKKITEIEGVEPEYAELDTSLYRDDIEKPEKYENYKEEYKELILRSIEEEKQSHE